MKNLQNFGIQEMNNKELIQVNGGNWMLALARAVIDFGMANNHVYEEQAANGVDITPIY